MAFLSKHRANYSDASKVLNRDFHYPASITPTPQLQRVITMPTPRRFGQEVDQNVRRGPNLSPAERQRIIAKREVGVMVRELAAEFGRSESAIKYTLRTYTKTATTEERPRSGRPRILSHHQEKIIYRKVRAAPKLEYSDLAKHAVFVNAEGTPSKPPSRSTLYRVLY
jgi:transposase-like protein